MTVLQIAVVGAGLIGQVHIRTINSNDDCCLQAIVDPDDNAIELAAGYQVPQFNALSTLLETQRPDAVIIATPNDLHVEQTRQCLAMGVPVLLEKPVATDHASGLVLADEVKRCGVPVLVGHHRAHSDIMRQACETIASDRLGRLVSIMGSAQFYKPVDYFQQAPWRSQPGGGPILINMIHEVHNLRMLMGEITHVQAMASRELRQFEVEDTVGITLRFANGALGTFLLSDTAASTASWELTTGENPAYPQQQDENCYWIAGTRGSLSVPTLRSRFHPAEQESSWWLRMSEVLAERETVDPLSRQLAHFVEVVRGVAEPRVSVEDGLTNLQVVEAIAQAAASGQMISLT
ncbi:Gfo/Idh/MocA family protein [Granulosicoccus sp. 3-233]|uniref:Gfo/Idh/MocA family protein n=1 Tax=Granulosicoccus sp. 3-233 TaxID=3417969 RepID=UPI003D32E872